jgi:hypothetical protein
MLFVTAAAVYCPGYDILALGDTCFCFLKQNVVARNPTHLFLVDIAYLTCHFSHTYSKSSVNVGIVSEN